jgi:hypothetical protein
VSAMKKLMMRCLLFVLVAMTSGVCQTTARQAITWDLAGLNGQAVPASISTTNSGFLNGSAFVVSDSELKMPVLEVSDLSGEMQVPYSVDLEPVVGTVQLWVKIPTLQDADVVSKKSDGNRSTYIIRINSEGRLLASIMTSKQRRGSDWFEWTMLQSLPQAIVPNRWTLVTLTWDGSKASLYVDGVRRDRGAYQADPNSGLAYRGQTPLLFASNPAQFHPYLGLTEFVGRIAMPKLFNYALTDAEASQEYIAIVGGSTVNKGKK